MPDTDIFFQSFSLVSQPVIVISGGRIEYMNSAALKLAACDHTGKPASYLLPSHILNVQAERFACTAFVGTKSCDVNVCSDGGRTVCVLKEKNHAVKGGDAIILRLRDSLTNIRFAAGCISIIGENNNDEKLLDYVRTLNRSYHSMKRTLDNVSALGQLERGELPFCPESFDVTDVCAAIVSTLRFMFRDNAPDITLHAEEHIRFIADRRLFEQLLLNLLSNSIANSGDSCRIRISLLRTGKNLVLGVSDNGCGIETELLPDIFERYKNRSGLDCSDGGAGMGLAIVRGIAELHGGAVIIESRGKDTGTNIRVMFSSEITPGTRFSIPDSPLEEEIARTVLAECSGLLPDSCYSHLIDE